MTPNGDGYNDQWYIKNEYLLPIEIIRIYNRWGELIFETTDDSERWDGTFRNQECMPGAYPYYVIGYCFNGQRFVKKGNITIIK
jgi:gliding motility-associated-like protein